MEAALARVQAQLGPADYDLFRRLVSTLAAVTAILSSQRAMVARLRRLFGLSSSERSRDVLRGQDAATAADPSSDSEPASADADASPGAPGTATAAGREPGQGHGRLPVSMYEAATHIAVPHLRLTVGGCCPDCRCGKLYELKEPAQVLRIFGQPILSGRCWDCQRLRCSSCGSVHTARAPAEAQGPKFDATAVAMIALGRYSLGLPHNRIEQLQKHLQLPVPASTQCVLPAGVRGWMRRNSKADLRGWGQYGGAVRGGQGRVKARSARRRSAAGRVEGARMARTVGEGAAPGRRGQRSGRQSQRTSGGARAGGARGSAASGTMG